MFTEDYHKNESVGSLLSGVYGWMSCALALTAATAYYVAATPAIFNYFFANRMFLFLLFFLQIGLVLGMVFFFVLLTADDTQKIKQMMQSMHADKETMGKIALLGALTLYLDFINLFLFLLNFMGNRRES